MLCEIQNQHQPYIYTAALLHILLILTGSLQAGPSSIHATQAQSLYMGVEQLADHETCDK